MEEAGNCRNFETPFLLWIPALFSRLKKLKEATRLVEAFVDASELERSARCKA